LSEIIWKTLIYQGNVFDHFEVSNNGQIRNAITQKIYKLHLNKTGYWHVCVSLGGRNKKKVFKVHKAVAETFIPNPEYKSDVNHKDGNKQNNAVSNLEWTTHAENIDHAEKMGLSVHISGTDNISAKLSKEDVEFIRKHYIPRDKAYGARALGRKFNIGHNHILEVINYKSYVNV
jgi:hypothetical protein